MPLCFTQVAAFSTLANRLETGIIGGMAKRKNPAAVSLGRKGGKARLTKMTAEERRAIARQGGLAKAKKVREAKKKGGE